MKKAVGVWEAREPQEKFNVTSVWSAMASIARNSIKVVRYEYGVCEGIAIIASSETRTRGGEEEGLVEVGISR